MKTFTLPDLGEGLPDAIIREWYVKPGDEVTTDQPMVAMETAKALVDVPAPFDGKIERLFGDEGDTIETGNPLVGFEGEADSAAPSDSGTVVGAIEASDAVLAENAGGVAIQASPTTRIKATPAVRALAKRLGVDLAHIQPAGERITAAEVEAAVGKSQSTTPPKTELPADMQALSPVKRAMVLSMSQSHAHVVPITLTEDADVSHWDKTTDITVTILRAIAHACAAEPVVNAAFNGEAMAFKLNDNVNIGIAVDTAHGLFVPVLKNVNTREDADLRTQINRYKEQAASKSIPQQDLHGATIILSNFGTIAGRYATPGVVPPMVAIVGLGKTREAVVARDGEMVIRKVLPISLSVDHRLVTGGEAARFLHAFIMGLQEK